MGRKHQRPEQGEAEDMQERAPHGGYGPYGQEGSYGGWYGGSGPDMAAGAGYGAPPGMQAGMGAGGLDAGLLQRMPAFLRSQATEQFVMGALIGAAAAWVLSDEQLRGRIVKSAMKLYSGVAGGLEEMKEQMADIRAEVDSERSDRT